MTNDDWRDIVAELEAENAAKERRLRDTIEDLSQRRKRCLEIGTKLLDTLNELAKLYPEEVKKHGLIMDCLDRGTKPLSLDGREVMDVQRMRDYATAFAELSPDISKTMRNSANEIESLTAENERLRAALTHPFLNQVLGDLEDADANDKTWEAAKSWMDYRDEVLGA